MTTRAVAANQCVEFLDVGAGEPGFARHRSDLPRPVRARSSARISPACGLAVEGRSSCSRIGEPDAAAVPNSSDIRAGPDGEVQIRSLAGGGAAGIDVDDAHAALSPRGLQSLDRGPDGTTRRWSRRAPRDRPLEILVALRAPRRRRRRGGDRPPTRPCTAASWCRRVAVPMKPLASLLAT